MDCFFSIIFKDFNKGIVKRLNRYQMILPIKPKPFMIKNKSTHFSTFFTEDSKLKELIRSRKESEPNALNIAQVDIIRVNKVYKILRY